MRIFSSGENIRLVHRLISLTTSVAPDDIQHAGIGRNVIPPVGIDFLFVLFWPARFVGKMVLENFQDLITQRNTVDKKQGPFHPSRAHQGIHQGDAGTRLACALLP